MSVVDLAAKRIKSPLLIVFILNKDNILLIKISEFRVVVTLVYLLSTSTFIQ